jgi:hypothetical protein
MSNELLSFDEVFNGNIGAPQTHSSSLGMGRLLNEEFIAYWENESFSFAKQKNSLTGMKS